MHCLLCMVSVSCETHISAVVHTDSLMLDSVPIEIHQSCNGCTRDPAIRLCQVWAASPASHCIPSPQWIWEAEVFSAQTQVPGVFFRQLPEIWGTVSIIYLHDLVVTFVFVCICVCAFFQCPYNNWISWTIFIFMKKRLSDFFQYACFDKIKTDKAGIHVSLSKMALSPLL